VFELYRHTLTYGTPSRSLAHSSWDTLYYLHFYFRLFNNAVETYVEYLIMKWKE
jgi:hypothetical protein